MAKYDVSFKVGEEGSEEVIKQLEKIQKYIGTLTKGTNTVKVGTDIDTSGIEQASKKTETYKEQVTSLGDAFQSLGSLSMGAGNFLQQFASMFGSDIIGTATRTITSYATVLASTGFSKSIDRYDTMTTFPKMMSMMGYDAEQATEAVNTLNEAVLGLPTSLSDIVEQAQTFTTLTGDLDKGVQYAIAANNTFLAGGADTSQVYYGTKQLQDLISSGELKTMEWQSLIKAMGPAWREIGKEMGYAEDELIDFRSSLIAGDIDGNEFLDAMVRAATGTGQLASMAGLSKEKISSALENIQTAFASTGQAIIETLDESFQAAEGMTLAEKIQQIGSAIKTDLKPYLIEFVQDNFPKIEAFIDKIEGYDWMGMISKIANWAGMLLEFYTNLVTKIPSGVVAFGMTWASPVGKFLSGFGSLLLGIGNMKGLKGFKIGSSIGETIGQTVSLVDGFKNIALKMANAAGMVAIIAELGLVIKEYTGVMEAISDMKLGGNFKNNLKQLAIFMAEAGGITAGITTVMSVLSGAGLGGIVGIGELLTAGMVGIVGMVGELIVQYAGILNDIGGLSLNKTKLKKNLSIIGDSMTEIQMIFGANGIIAIVEGIAEIAGAGVVSIDMSAMGKIVDMLVKIAEIDDINIDFKKLNKNIENIRLAMDALIGDDGMWSALVKSDITNSLSKASENMTTIFDSWSSIVTTFKEKMPTDDEELEDVSERIKSTSTVIKDAVQAITDNYGPLSALLDEWATKHLKGTVGNLDDILQEWATVISHFKTNFYDEDGKLKDSKTKMSGIVTQIKTQSKNIRDVINELTNGEGGGSAILDWLYKLQTDSLDDAVANLDSILTTWKNIQGKIADFEIVDISGKINQMIEQINSVFDALSGTGNTFSSKGDDGITTISPFYWLDNLVSSIGENAQQTTNMTVAQKLSTAIEYLQSVITSYINMQTTVQGFELDEEVPGKIKTMFENVATIFDGLYAPDLTGTAGSIESWQLVLDSMDGLLSQIITMGETASGDGSTAFTNLYNFFITRLNNFKNRLAEMEIDEIPDKVENIKTIFKKLDGVLNYVAAMDIESPMEKITQINTLIEGGIKPMLTKLTEVQTLLDTLGASGEEIPVIQMLMNMFTGLNNTLSSENVDSFNTNLLTLVDNLDAVTLSLYELYTQLTNLQPIVEGYVTVLEEHIDPEIDAILEMMIQIPDSLGLISDAITIFLNGSMFNLMSDLEDLYQWVEDVSEAFEVDFVFAMGSAVIQMQIVMQALVEMTGDFKDLKSATDESKQSFNQWANALVQSVTKIRSTISAVDQLTNALNRIPTSKSINIGLTGKGASYAATGGLITSQGVIYRANGGFTPRGTDTVPAMLTPGEFVMNKDAVRTVGPSFLRRLNHGDIAGAMARVSRRFGTTAQYHVSNVTNHDNHATVNQYITTTNEQYAYRRARRFVEAL